MPIHYSHATVRCADVQASAAFYRDILGFEVSPLAGFDFAIEEVRSAGNMFLHLIQVGGDGLNGLLGGATARPFPGGPRWPATWNTSA